MVGFYERMHNFYDMYEAEKYKRIALEKRLKELRKTIRQKK